jgi:2-phospho-L-lactate/phosphoenolpyruvate guanylyltransferase
MTPMTVVVPAKRLELAKSRLAIPDRMRRALSLAFLADTVAMTLSSRQVGQVLVVTCDPEIASTAGAEGADILWESQPMGLNEAIDLGRDHVRDVRPASHVAVLVGDLPTLALADLDDAFAQFRTRSRPLFVADHCGSGTTFLAHPAGSRPTVCFGPGSAHRHVRAGFAPADGKLASLRLDIDTWQELETAVSFPNGGLRTRRLVETLLGSPTLTSLESRPSSSPVAAL